MTRVNYREWKLSGRKSFGSTGFQIFYFEWVPHGTFSVRPSSSSSSCEAQTLQIAQSWGSESEDFTAMDEETPVLVRRTSSRIRKVASKMVAALASSDNRMQAALARLEALENDNAGTEAIEINDDDEASLDDDDEQVHMQKRLKNMKRKTRQAKALENAKKAPRTFMELLHEANLEALPPHVPSYLRAAVGPPSSTSRRYFCTVCGFTANYTCVRCGVRFCSSHCQVVHNDTRCLKFVA